MKAEIPKIIEKEEIRNLPIIAFDGEIVVLDQVQYVQEAVDFLTQFDVIGFDTETKPSFKKGSSNQHKVAVLQLYADSRAYLFRLNKIGLPQNLADLLANPKILKVGAAVRDDIKGLKALTPFEDEGFIDIQNIAAKLEIEVRSLRKLTAMFFCHRLSKTQQLSNWESDTLSDSQAVYAATDAWISYELYRKMLVFL
ncbi:MAG: 3'-5' exonuclease domain-containing protein 2 [Bacteroidales bacterium]|jgi:ribonuclease D|nr:3'-5' exonuclease domain-containing protein 2 [Bacteroidales bacterium]